MMASYKEILEQDTFKNLEVKMEGKDGRDVTGLDQLLHPGPDARPLELNNENHST
jgi:hypothetical protein